MTSTETLDHSEREGPTTVPCARHSKVQTALRCSRCETPICPKCMVQTPVGLRCPDCAKHPHPTVQPPPDAAPDPVAETLFCANHAKTPTNLRCSRCGKPICLKCSVETPVGLRCAECASVAHPTIMEPPAPPAEPSASAVRCANHRDVATNITCGRCGKPICPRCVVQTPVGGRCQECAQLRPPPLMQVGSGLLLRAAGGGVLVAILGGLAAGLFRIGFLLILLAAGYVTGEAVSRLARRRMATSLAVLAPIALLVGFGVGLTLPATIAALATGGGPQVALLLLLSGVLAPLGQGLWGLLFYGLAIAIAVNRVR